MDVAVQLHKLFGTTFREVINSCLLIISKVDENVATMEELIGCIREIGEANQKLGTEGAMLIKTLINQNKIIGFPIPGKMNDHTLDQIKENIKKIPLYHVAQEPNVALSPEGKVAVEGLLKHVEKQKNSVL